MSLVSTSPLTSPRRATAIVVALIAGLIAAALPTQQASAAINGAITGTLSSSEGSVLASARVDAYRPDGSLASSAQTDAAGFYSLDYLPAGSYAVKFNAPDGTNWIPEYLHDAPTFASAAFVDVGEGSTVENVDATLDPGATVSGHVSRVTGDPVANIGVRAYDSERNEVGFGYAASSGDYTIAGLRPGSYTLRFAANSYATEWWENSSTFAAASYITVGSLATVQNKDAVLAPEGLLFGTVTASESSNGLGNVFVDLYLDGEYVATNGLGTDQSGAYSFGSLPTGDYTLRFRAPSGGNYVTEWYNNQYSQYSANTIGVIAGESYGAATVGLSKASTISGTITDETGVPIAGHVYVTTAGQYNFSTEAYSTSNGEYTLSGIPEGEYVLGFDDNNSGYSYISEYYYESPTWEDASIIVAAPYGNTFTGYNGTLQKIYFRDVTLPDSPFFTPINWMYTQGISTGSPSGYNRPLYKPDTAVSRMAMASFLYKLSGETFTPPATQSFSDVDPSHPFYTAIEWMKSTGISTGTPTAGLPAFKATDPVSRQAMALFLARYKGAGVSAPTTQSFADVPVNSAPAAAIEWMANQGIATGTPQPSGLPLFLPLDPVSRQAMASFLYRMEHPAP